MKTATKTADIIILGSGAAGMATALALAPRKVLLVTKTPALNGGSTAHAQGGIAVAVGKDDTPQSHTADTLVAGAGMCDKAAVDALTHGGPAAIDALLELGMPFDRHAEGALHIGHEAAHSHRRVLHAGGDATGANLSATLAAAVEQATHIEVLTDTFAWQLLKSRNHVVGVLTHNPQGWLSLVAPHTILATGGIGQLFAYTTNPAESTGDGLALALRAGAQVQDVEFMQFHPTALAVKSKAGRLPLLTEALRGEGALLVDSTGHRFMPDIHKDAELAPRDVVARAVWARTVGTCALSDLPPDPAGRGRTEGEEVFLDARAAFTPQRFPTVAAACAAHGLDPAVDLLPVAPAAHYHMGGVVTNLDGATTLPGLWAVGEVARTGVHGANRLASNSLLECLVFARRCAAAILALPQAAPKEYEPCAVPAVADAATMPTANLRTEMYKNAGLVRSAQGLQEALCYTTHLMEVSMQKPLLTHPTPAQTRAWGEWLNRLAVGGTLLQAAAARTQSCGAHFRSDTAYNHATFEGKPLSIPRTTTRTESVNPWSL